MCFGAHVTAVCSAANAELVRSLGADEVIDYNAEDFTLANSRYDIIYDSVGKSSYGQCKRALKPKGSYLSPVFGLHHLLLMGFSKVFSDKKAIFSATGLLPIPQLKVMLAQLLEIYKNNNFQT